MTAESTTCSVGTSGTDDDVDGRVLAGEGVPDEFEPALQSLSDLARNPLDAPLATLAAALIGVAIGYQAVDAALRYHPVVGLLVVAVVLGVYPLCRRLWAIQHRYVVRELARMDELDRLRE